MQKSQVCCIPYQTKPIEPPESPCQIDASVWEQFGNRLVMAKRQRLCNNNTQTIYDVPITCLSSAYMLPITCLLVASVKSLASIRKDDVCDKNANHCHIPAPYLFPFKEQSQQANDNG